MKRLLAPKAQIGISWLPNAGVVAFVMLYFYAASLYPGGTSLDSASQGYDHLSNYWCDLLVHDTYGGRMNASQPVAILATVVLPLALVSFWLQVTVLFRAPSAANWIVPVSGTASMIFASLIFTQLHDLMINVAFTLGFVAFVTTTLCLARSRHVLHVGLAVVSLSLAIADWWLWQTGSLIGAVPLVQKIAYLAFFAWIIATSHLIRRALTTRGHGANVRLK